MDPERSEEPHELGGEPAKPAKPGEPSDRSDLPEPADPAPAVDPAEDGRAGQYDGAEPIARNGGARDGAGRASRESADGGPSDPYEPEGAEEDDDLEDDREETGESVTIEISGLSLYTHHGATAAEREVGQRLVLDLRLDLGETDATATDSIEDTVDYGEVCQLVALVAQQRSHKTLERLCSTIADRLLGDYELEGVWVKATKPEPPIPLSVDEVSVEVWREAEE